MSENTNNLHYFFLVFFTKFVDNCLCFIVGLHQHCTGHMATFPDHTSEGRAQVHLMALNQAAQVGTPTFHKLAK